MTSEQARTPIGRALEWWGRIQRPELPAGEQYLADVPAHILGLRPWKLKGGRLLITNRRVIYLAAVPRILPRSLLGSPPISLEQGAISEVHAERALAKAILTSAPGFEILSVRTNDGRNFRFQVWDATALQAQIKSTVGPSRVTDNVE